MQELGEYIGTFIGLGYFLVLAKSDCASPVQVALDFVHLNTGVRILSQAGDLSPRQRMAVQIISFQMVVDWDHVRFTIYDTAKPSNARRLKEAARFVIIEHLHHDRSLLTLPAHHFD